jgi:hypothetical protein
MPDSLRPGTIGTVVFKVALFRDIGSDPHVLPCSPRRARGNTTRGGLRGRNVGEPGANCVAPSVLPAATGVWDNAGLIRGDHRAERKPVVEAQMPMPTEHPIVIESRSGKPTNASAVQLTVWLMTGPGLSTV